MDYKILRDCQDVHDEVLVRQAADLHYDSLSYRSFITSFGRKFLYELYRAILDYRLGFLICTESEGRLAGFILACPDSGPVMSVVYKRFWTFAWIIGPKVLAHPSLLKKVYETRSYAQAEGLPIKAELLVIAVDERLRSQGLGAALVKRLDEEFAGQGISEYKVTVHEAMERTNKFYVRYGMTLARTFTFAGVPWNIYVNRVAARTAGQGGRA